MTNIKNNNNNTLKKLSRAMRRAATGGHLNSKQCSLTAYTNTLFIFFIVQTIVHNSRLKHTHTHIRCVCVCHHTIEKDDGQQRSATDQVEINPNDQQWIK